ncbi:MAG: transcriptional regulator, partial [Moraxellaceae bacterium]
GVLRAESQEKILIYLLMRDKGYGSSIAEFYGVSQNAVQKQLARLEEDSVIVGEPIGKVRQYQLNPRYAFYEPLKLLLKTAVEAYPKDLVKKLIMVRTRPRKAGKAIR